MQLRSDDPVAAYDFGAYLTNRWKCDQRTVDLFRAATRLAPRYYDAYWLEACALQRAKRYSESIDVARKLLSLNPNDAAAFGIIGGDYACLGQDDTALTALHKALSLSPCNPAVYVHLLNIYEKRKDYPNVARTCLDYLAGNPAGKDSNTYRDSLADAYENQQQWPLCERYSRAALSVNANDSVAHDNLGTALAHEGQNKAARAEWNRAIEIGDQPAAVADARQGLAKLL